MTATAADGDALRWPASDAGFVLAGNQLWRAEPAAGD
jgi:hypothetical protein